MITGTCEQTTTKRQGGVWDCVSPSRLGLWAKCPLGWKFRYLDGIRTPTTPSLFLGRCIHSGLEHFHRHRQLGVSISAADAVQHVRDSWGQAVADEDMKFATTAAETALQQQAAGLITTYIDQVPTDEPRPLAVETTMEVPLVDPLSGEDLGIPLLGSSTWCSTVRPAPLSSTSRRRHAAGTCWRSRTKYSFPATRTATGS